MRFLRWIENIAVGVGCFALAMLVATITVSVAGRYFFSMPIPDDLVISEFLMVFVVFLPLAAVQARREHVFVSIFTEWMTDKSKGRLNILGLVVGCVMFTIMATASFSDFYGAWSISAYADGPLKLPEAPARFAVFAGFALFAIRLFVDSISSIYAYFLVPVSVSKSGDEPAIVPPENLEK